MHLRVTMRVVLQVTVPWMFSAWQMYSPESSGVTSTMTSTWVLWSLRTWVRWVGVTCTSFTNHFTSASGCESSSTSSLKTHKMSVSVSLTVLLSNTDPVKNSHWGTVELYWGGGDLPSRVPLCLKMDHYSYIC